VQRRHAEPRSAGARDGKLRSRSTDSLRLFPPDSSRRNAGVVAAGGL